MRNSAKLIVICIFALGALFLFLSSNNLSRIGAAVFSGASTRPTPPNNTNAPANAVNAASNVNAVKATPSNTASPAAPSNTSTASTATGGKTIPKNFTLGKNSLSEYGEAPFDHENHASKNYSPDGKSVIACVECHHTDQPVSALNPPLSTSERNETLTMDVFQKSSQKVKECGACHFQDGEVPDGKTMPTLKGRDLNNKNAYHDNCNTCHDAALKARSDLKAKNKTFATTNDCGVCHKTN